MELPSSAELLSLWEEGARLPPADRAWLLARAAARARDPRASDAATVACLSVGQADHCLLALRIALFGTRFDAVSRCPNCSEVVDLSFTSGDLPLPRGHGEPSREPFSAVIAGGCAISFRAPTWPDLLSVAHETNRAAARSALARLCIVSQPGNSTGAEPIPESMLEGVAHALEQQDPLACLRVALHCPTCGHEWLSFFDAAAFLWEELDQWARQLLREVHMLAKNYGWSEAQVLALPPKRRRFYLELLAA